MAGEVSRRIGSINREPLNTTASLAFLFNASGCRARQSVISKHSAIFVIYKRSVEAGEKKKKEDGRTDAPAQIPIPLVFEVNFLWMKSCARIRIRCERLFEHESCDLISLETDGKQFNSHLNASDQLRLYVLSGVTFVGSIQFRSIPASFDGRSVYCLKRIASPLFYCTFRFTLKEFHCKFVASGDFEQGRNLLPLGKYVCRKIFLRYRWLAVVRQFVAQQLSSLHTYIYIYIYMYARIRTILLASRPGESGIESNRLSERKLAGWEIV